MLSALCFCKSANQIHVLSSFHFWGLCGLWLLNPVHIVPKYSNMVGAVCIVYFIRTWGLFSPKQLTDRNVPSKLPFRCLDCCLIFCQKGNTRLQCGIDGIFYPVYQNCDNVHPLVCPQKIRKLFVLPKNAPAPTPENLHVLPENVFSQKMTCIAQKCRSQKMTCVA